VLNSLDADVVRHWCAAALAALHRHQQEINELNVYPVPDSDTGTNLVMTIDAAQRALLAEPELPDFGKVLHCMARGALLGARGNSGVILSQVLRGLAEALGAHSGPVRGRALAGGLRSAVDAGYRAVAVPVEGTILTVARSAAEAAEACDSDDLAVVAAAAATGAEMATARTPEQLPALARAGVVDAGGQGLCVLLRALVEVILADQIFPLAGSSWVDRWRELETPATGDPPAATLKDRGITSGAVKNWTALPEVAVDSSSSMVRETGSEEYDYEVQYLLDAAVPAVDLLREALARLGDSLVIVGTGDGSWHVHVHVNDVGAAIEEGIAAGRPYQIRVSHFSTALTTSGQPPARTVAVFIEGEGLVELLEREGARVVTTLDGLTGQVVALGTPPERGADCELRVIPLRSPVQALAALAVHDPLRSFEDDVIAMAEAAGACRHAEVTIATKEALTVAGACRPGDVVALIDGEVNLIAHDLIAASTTLLDRLLAAGGELVTLLLGADAPSGLDRVLRAHLASRWPFVEVRTYQGGQRQLLLVGVE
jgi:DAK2 domain fusion protein YloV